MAISAPIAPIDFEALVQMAQQPVLRYLCAHTGSASEGAELTQETFVRAYCALARGERPQAPLPWVLGTCSWMRYAPGGASAARGSEWRW
jgi:hypothetical protein